MRHTYTGLVSISTGGFQSGSPLSQLGLPHLQVANVSSPALKVAPSTVSPITPWRKEMEILVLGTVSCASVVFLLLTAIICYKAIKRKPLRKEENGTSRGEYAMSSRCKQQVVETNNTGV
ncbi:proline-rich membrane anchor 1 isoform X3 [Carassius auratus]|uniref:Proline-rich membrane anchor 1 isoform X3 n=1 Tax=Carassius auratus TaxID=7957 RepID=A0A6P6RP63_CARAU|nr:proline-rich membrane anchor 1-like isoform X3 [Carassius auratus]